MPVAARDIADVVQILADYTEVARMPAVELVVEDDCIPAADLDAVHKAETMLDFQAQCHRAG